jgi:hypothetical protein
MAYWNERTLNNPRLPIYYWQQCTCVHEIWPSTPPKKVNPLTDFSEEHSYTCLITSMFLFFTDNFSNLHVNKSSNEVRCHSKCGTIKIRPCSKALSAEHRPKFCSPSSAMVTSPYLFYTSAKIEKLIDYLRFYVPLKNFSLIRRRHHSRWRAAKFKPMLGAQGLWAGRDLYRATPAVTRDLGFFRSYPKDRPIQSPLTTHEGMWRIYSNPDPHGGIDWLLTVLRPAQEYFT